MIYMDNVLQRKIIPLLQYTLDPDGILFLGTSETIGEYVDLFDSYNFKWKIFKHKPSLAVKQTDYPDKFYCDAQQRILHDPEVKLPGAIDVQALVERVILDEYASTGVLINDKYEILHFVGKTDKYLAPPMKSLNPPMKNCNLSMRKCRAPTKSWKLSGKNSSPPMRNWPW
ncbi:MAG: CheR family methyltransferase [Desulfobacterales bacterium]|nr:CheR family methyltransferase [Desulfobacterales bacterium]